MDESDLAAGLVLVASLLAFAYISLGESCAGLSGDLKRGTGKNGAPRALFFGLLSSTSLVAVTASAIALFFAIPGITWLFITPLILGLLVLIIFVEWATLHLAARYTKLTVTCVSPLLAALRISPIHTQSSEPNGFSLTSGADTGQTCEQNGEAVITEEEQANLDERERSMIRSKLRLDEHAVRTVMIPRVDLVAVDIDSSPSEVAQKMLDSGHSQLPVYKETIDTIIGIMHSRDLLPLLAQKSPWPPLEQLVRPPFFVPESKHLDELLLEFQKRRVQMALVVDEHGGTEGLVTLEDLLEEIVGEIEDEFSTTSVEPQITPTGTGDYILDARTSLATLENLLPLAYDKPKVATIGGLVYSELGKIPQPGDEIVYGGLRIKVLSTLGRRLRKLYLSTGRPPA